jgi:sulfur transfer protein SufE
MDARHCAGTEMAELMAYAASVGSERPRRKAGAVGFIGNATDATAHYFGRRARPRHHAARLIGYAGSTVRAAEMFHETFPDDDLTVLVDYFGRRSPTPWRSAGASPSWRRRAARRPARHPRRPLRRGAGPAQSYAVLERHAPRAIRRYRNEANCATWSAPASPPRRSGTCAKARRGGLRQGEDRRLLRLRPGQVQGDGRRRAPVDVIGTGSFLPGVEPRPTPPPTSSPTTASRASSSAASSCCKVRGCTSQVWIVDEVKPGAPSGAPTLHFIADSDAHIVKGLIAVLLSIYNGRTPEEILAVDIKGAITRLDLEQHLSPNRANGLYSMVERIRALAAREAAGSPSPNSA